MATPVEMPKLGNTVEDCLLSKWIKAKGESVAAGEIVAEIETDKATFEVPAPVAGVLLATFFEEGSLVPVFTNICVIGALGEDVSAFAPGSAGEKASGAGAPPAAGSQPAPTEGGLERPPQAVSLPHSESSSLSPRARRFAEEHRMDPRSIAGSGPGGRVLEQDLRDAFFSGRTRGLTAAGTDHGHGHCLCTSAASATRSRAGCGNRSPVPRSTP